MPTQTQPYDHHYQTHEYGACLVDGIKGLYLIQTSQNYHKGFQRIIWAHLLRHGRDPNCVSFEFHEDRSLPEYAKVHIGWNAKQVHVRFQHRPFSATDARFGHEMLLHESRHVYQALFIAQPAAASEQDPSEVDARRFQEIAFELYRLLSPHISAYFALRDFAHLGNVVDAGGLGLSHDQHRMLDVLVGQLVALQRSPTTPACLFAQVLLSEINILTEVARARVLVDGPAQPSVAQLLSQLAAMNALPSNETDAELFGAQCEFAAYLCKHLAQASRDSGRYQDAVKYLAAALRAFPNARHVKYLSDCLLSWARLHHSKEIAFLAREIFAKAFGVPHHHALAHCFFRHIKNEDPSLGSSSRLKVGPTWMGELASIPKLDDDLEFSSRRSSELRMQGVNSLTADIASATLILIQMEKWKPTGALARSPTVFAGHHIDFDSAPKLFQLFIVSKTLIHLHKKDPASAQRLQSIMPIPIVEPEVLETIERVISVWARMQSNSSP